MALSLRKGENVSLSSQARNLKRIMVGLGWNPRVSDGQEFDLDASAFLLGAGGKVGSDDDLIYYNQLSTRDRSVVHTGDNRDGQGEGDDESIMIDLERLERRIERIVIAVTIHEATQRRQNFGQVPGSFIRVVNEESGTELLKYDLGEDFSTQTAVIFGEIYREGTDWRFSASGRGFSGGLEAMARSYGVDVG